MRARISRRTACGSVPQARNTRARSGSWVGELGETAPDSAPRSLTTSDFPGVWEVVVVLLGPFEAHANAWASLRFWWQATWNGTASRAVFGRALIMSVMPLRVGTSGRSRTDWLGFSGVEQCVKSGFRHPLGCNDERKGSHAVSANVVLGQHAADGRLDGALCSGKCATERRGTVVAGLVGRRVSGGDARGLR